MRCLIAIVGPTAVGKSALGVQIAQNISGEIINADSRQIYRYMDIGTAKPDGQERKNVPHHIIDIIYPDESYSVARFQEDANIAIEGIWACDKIPILIGGSGQYIWALLDSWNIPRIEPDLWFREHLSTRAREEGYEKLHAELQSIDPVTASSIQPTNIRRVIRALEIYKQTGKRASELNRKGTVDYPILIIGLTTERDYLYAKIDARVDRMIDTGLVDEVKQLLSLGYGPELPSMSGIGYHQISKHLTEGLDLEEAVKEMKFATHRYARSQYNWFRLTDTRIKWYSMTNDNIDEIHYTIKTFFKFVDTGKGDNAK
jgi:tRNA dimethylallyltransferase